MAWHMASQCERALLQSSVLSQNQHSSKIAGPLVFFRNDRSLRYFGPRSLNVPAVAIARDTSRANASCVYQSTSQPYAPSVAFRCTDTFRCGSGFES